MSMSALLIRFILMNGTTSVVFNQIYLLSFYILHQSKESVSMYGNNTTKET